MTLPKSVAAQVEAAEAAQKALIEGRNTSEAEAVDTPQEPTEAPAEVTAENGSVPEPMPAESQEPGINWQQRAEAAEQRYRVLQGKYNAEIKAAKDELGHGNNAELDQLRQQVSMLSAQLNQAQTQPPAQPQAAPVSMDLSRLREDYGDEFVDDVGRLIHEQAGRLVEERLRDVGQSVNQLTHQQKVGQLGSMLAQQGIDFNAVNADPLFLQWLSEADPLSGMPRQRLLDAAFGEQGDLSRTVTIFRQFVESNPAHVAAPSVTTPNPERYATVKPSAPLQQAPAERASFDPNAYQRLCNQKALGRITDEEFTRLEREMFAAQRGA
ncbi:hypothetical protein KUW19_00820 [Ferrimonas balearica]|uniref:hypothetical protein n=1 Tax=Ferrimonas balearica TaxID=44012 RepID=UPI001C96481C|nr:hypothetical protein [Ferrimonas balearica]MBY6105019.1 hypothetical protein [Ferrimonas balearica]